ncbi:MAG: hypothetical protein ACUVQ3_02260 [bacterium]
MSNNKKTISKLIIILRLIHRSGVRRIDSPREFNIPASAKVVSYEIMPKDYGGLVRKV